VIERVPVLVLTRRSVVLKSSESEGYEAGLSFSSDDLREMFYLWLEDEPTTLPFSVMQDALAGMEDTMPEAVCREHGFPIGCSVGHAARSSIGVVGPEGISARHHHQLQGRMSVARMVAEQPG
jgi:hypothetical protein